MTALPAVPLSVADPFEEAWLEFELDNRVRDLSEHTRKFYHYTLQRGWIPWLQQAGVTAPDQVTRQHIRHYLVYLADERGLARGGVRAQGRAIRRFITFWRAEGWIPKDAEVDFEMPKETRERQPAVSAEDALRLLKACQSARERALVLLLLDSGVRRGEATALNWGDLNLQSGQVMVRSGKGRKTRATFVSPPTLKELLKYRRQVTHEADDPLFRSERSGAGDGRLTGHGMRGLLGRIANRAGLPKLTAHAFRRGCATMALRAGMNALHLQGMLGHTTLEMVRRYAQAVDDDLQAAHAAHSPVQSWLK